MACICREQAALKNLTQAKCWESAEEQRLHSKLQAARVMQAGSQSTHEATNEHLA